MNDQANRRFIKYMANLIHYNSINYDKKRRLKASRFILTLDNNEKNLGSELMAVFDSEPASANLKYHITDPFLYQAYEKLPKNQQLILSYAYVQKLNDREIAQLMHVSQQNISKHRLNALSKLRQELNGVKKSE